MQGRIDARTLGAARMLTEVSALTLGGILALSCLGLNINALLLPAGVVLAFASRDLLQNLIAGALAAVVYCLLPLLLCAPRALSCSSSTHPNHLFYCTNPCTPVSSSAACQASTWCLRSPSG